MLDAFLDYFRATLMMQCQDLSADDLRSRPVEPSSLSLLGLVSHMAEVERGWFRRGVAGEDIAPVFEYDYDTDEDAEFNQVDTADAEAALAAFAAEVDACRAAVAEKSLDDTFVSQRRGEVSLRWVMVHMIEEYARHCGHADLIRERIDGTVGV